MEHRCCKEMTPAMHKMTFDGSIEKVSCITQHEDFSPLTSASGCPRKCRAAAKRQGMVALIDTVQHNRLISKLRI